jgi:hypothetical protein
MGHDRPVATATAHTLLAVLTALLLALLLAPAAGATTAPGTFLWRDIWNAKTPGAVANVHVTTAATGDIYVACSILRLAPDRYDVIVARYRPDGTRTWVRSWSRGVEADEWVEGIAADPDGNLVVCGWFSGGRAGTPDWFVVKFDRGGDRLWTKTVAGIAGGDDRALDVVVNGAGRIYVTGSVGTSAGGKDWRTAKLAPSGATLWARSYAGPEGLDDLPSAMALDVDGNVYVTGFEGTVMQTRRNLVILSYAATGTRRWARVLDVGREETGADVAVRRSGVAVAGRTVDAAGADHDALAVRYTRAGALVSWSTFNGPVAGADHFSSAGIDGPGRSAFGGFMTNDLVNQRDAALQWFEAGGATGLHWGWAGDAARDDQVTDLHVAADGTLWATGWIDTLLTGRDVMTWSSGWNAAYRWDDRWSTMARDIGDDLVVTSSAVYVAGRRGNDLLLLKYVR